jgi:hypothetical protein
VRTRDKGQALNAVVDWLAAQTAGAEWARPGLALSA